MAAAAVRPCGCPPDAQDHLEPEPDWIGNTPIMHGERDEEPGAAAARPIWAYAPCLCGHPDYATCPEVWGGSLMDMEIHRNEEAP